MGKTPDEIKKGLEFCTLKYQGGCRACPYYNPVKGMSYCKKVNASDALALIQQLEAANAELLTRCERLERERDAAVEDMKNSRDCQCCKHYDVKWDEPCVHCDHDNNCFEWRGVKEE